MRRMRRPAAAPRLPLLLGVVALLLGVYATLRAPAAAEPAPAAAPPGRPNIVFVLTDDLDLAMIQQLPTLRDTFASTGTTFSHHLVSLSLCCPSRSSILRGQYAHNTRVFGNKPPSGGYQVFHDSGDDTSTIATWLHDAGYRTALFGKYLNGYPGQEGDRYVPPGWDEWAVPSRGNAYAEFDYDLNENGQVVSYGHHNRDYLTSVLDKKATAFITAAGTTPFFLYLATFAPHSPATPPPRYEDALPDLVAPTGPAFDEGDLSDKPSWLSGFLHLGPRQRAKIDSLYRKRVQSMLGVQDLVTDLVDTLTTTGQLDRTWIVFTSDNGFHMGEHRLTPGKNTAFDTDLRVPLMIRGPGVPAGRVIDALTANLDFAPTFAALAGVTPPDWVDGRSLLPLFTDAAPPWRQALLLEHGGPDALDLEGEADGTGLHEPPDGATPGETAPEATAGKPGNGTNGVPIFTGIRTARYTYVRYVTGEQELYDDVVDPNQLDNLGATADPALLARLRVWTDRLATCRGAACRETDAAPPPEP